MITSLQKILADFPRSANHTCCFTHILNLVVKSIMRHLTHQKKIKKKGKSDNDDDARELPCCALDRFEDELESENGEQE